MTCPNPNRIGPRTLQLQKRPDLNLRPRPAALPIFLPMISLLKKANGASPEEYRKAVKNSMSFRLRNYGPMGVL
jgi:hypothetical protein